MWIISCYSSLLSGTYKSPTMYISSFLIIHSPKGTVECKFDNIGWKASVNALSRARASVNELSCAKASVSELSCAHAAR